MGYGIAPPVSLVSNLEETGHHPCGVLLELNCRNVASAAEEGKASEEGQLETLAFPPNDPFVEG